MTMISMRLSIMTVLTLPSLAMSGIGTGWGDIDSLGNDNGEAEIHEMILYQNMTGYVLDWPRRDQRIQAGVGDVDWSWSVDSGDLSILNQNWGCFTHAWSKGDVSQDGLVDISDLGIVAGAWGADYEETVIPEPLSVIIFIMGLVLIFLLKTGGRVVR